MSLSHAPVLFIATPCTNACHTEFTFAFASLIGDTKTSYAFAYSKGGSTCHNDNLLVHFAKKLKAKYILFIENDMSFPSNAADRLVNAAEKNNFDIVGCDYLFKTIPHDRMMVPLSPPSPSDIFAINRYQEVYRLPFGFILIRMSVFDKLLQPYFIPQPSYTGGLLTVGTSDYPFCDAAREAGFRIWMDIELSSQIVHWDGSTGVQYMKEAPGYRYLIAPPDYSQSYAESSNFGGLVKPNFGEVINPGVLKRA